MNSLTTDIGYISLNKYNEQLCGDRIEVVEYEDCMILVLADGLGSGVKANILSTLTSKIIATMMANGMPIEECVKTIASTLPVCNQRQIAYSTFTIIQITNNEQAILFQFDNPKVILLRDGISIDYPCQEEVIDGKKILKSIINVKPCDIFVAMSDGALYAGVGKNLNYGWQRENIIDYLEARYIKGMTAKLVSSIVAEECNRLYDNMPGDDTTVAAVKIRSRQTVNMMIGPPADILEEKNVLDLFFSKSGQKVVCGGTTSTIVSKYLNKPIITSLDYFDPTVPPIGKIEGVDLVTEGVVTISRVLKYAKAYLSSEEVASEWNDNKDGASLLCQKLFVEATDVNFFVGKAINPAHQNPNLPISIGIKIRLIDELSRALEKMGKKIKVNYF